MAMRSACRDARSCRPASASSAPVVPPAQLEALRARLAPLDQFESGLAARAVEHVVSRADPPLLEEVRGRGPLARAISVRLLQTSSSPPEPSAFLRGLGPEHAPAARRFGELLAALAPQCSSSPLL